IMGKNWIHIQDGTGEPAKNTHDLVVTTMGEPATGDNVTIEGTLSADKDFGSGYHYDAIVEDATVSK
ncbi:MAG: DNA-binding protein, partial [Desulfobulbaceae bacterium]|nr:DNA-binding protein [Desulfobulbaceae bacterium]